MHILDAVNTSGLATALEGAISFDTMIANLTPFVGLLGGIVVFAFSYRFVKKLITGASKGKAKM